MKREKVKANLELFCITTPSDFSIIFKPPSLRGGRVVGERTLEWLYKGDFPPET